MTANDLYAYHTLFGRIGTLFYDMSILFKHHT